ncbi:unnamed protein product, partial [Didymodactylos carnosus]
MIHSTPLHPESSLSTQTGVSKILSSAALADTSTTTITTTSISRVAIISPATTGHSSSDAGGSLPECSIGDI